MEELARLKKAVKPHEILLVVDALTGQDAVNAAEGFNDKLGVDGVIMTKMDGDARGGAALSVKKVTGKPIKFIGVGEKIRRPGAFSPGKNGQPHSRHGRHALADRESSGKLRRGAGRQAGKEAAQERIHAGRLS